MRLFRRRVAVMQSIWIATADNLLRKAALAKGIEVFISLGSGALDGLDVSRSFQLFMNVVEMYSKLPVDTLRTPANGACQGPHLTNYSIFSRIAPNNVAIVHLFV
jgi:hypothetical protein